MWHLASFNCCRSENKKHKLRCQIYFIFIGFDTHFWGNSGLRCWIMGLAWVASMFSRKHTHTHSGVLYPTISFLVGYFTHHCWVLYPSPSIYIHGVLYPGVLYPITLNIHRVLYPITFRTQGTLPRHTQGTLPYNIQHTQGTLPHFLTSLGENMHA